jgi:peroxiredoxin
MGQAPVSWLVIAALLMAAPTSGREAHGGRGALDLIRPRQPAPARDFTVPGLSGRRLSLHDFKGQVVLLEFWATWSLPCKEQLPALERLHRRYRGRGFTVLAISIDAEGAMAAGPVVKKLGLTFPLGLDSRMAAAELYAVRVLPSTILIDRRQKAVAFAVGARDWEGAAARALIESLLK